MSSISSYSSSSIFNKLFFEKNFLNKIPVIAAIITIIAGAILKQDDKINAPKNI